MEADESDVRHAAIEIILWIFRSCSLDEANRGDSSLHAALFLRDPGSAFVAVEQLDAGGVMVSDSSDFRFDATPLGRYKIEEMSQPKIVCFDPRVAA
jgi:glyceraldehyde-3-phosphate dehydrogenase (NADP+)